MKRKFFVFLLVALLFAQPYITYAQDDASPDAADDAGGLNENDPEADGGDDDNAPVSGNDDDGLICGKDEFWEWIANNPNGGSITLGQNLDIDRHFMVNGDLHIETGSYGVTLNGGSPYCIELTGEGVDTPVLTVVATGLSSWDGYLPGYCVTARGRNGEGGIAVHMSADEAGTPDYIELRGLIKSTGRNAVGIKLDYPIKAHFLTVYVEGEDSAAIRAPTGTEVYYGILEASGSGSVIASDGVLLDTCKLIGDASGAEVVNRRIIALAGNWLYLPLLQNQNPRTSSLYRTFTGSKLQFLLSGDENNPSEVRRIYAGCKSAELLSVDTSVIGRVTIPIALFEVFQGLGLEDNYPLELTVDVREAGKPCIIALNFDSDIEASHKYAYFQTSDVFYFTFSPVDDDYTLWRSDDEGQNWYDFSDSPDVVPGDSGLKFYYDDITDPIWFCIENANGKYSNVAVIYGFEEKSYGVLGGDRTGVDRGGEDDLPGVIEATPTPKPPKPSNPTPNPTDDPAIDPLPEPTSEPSLEPAPEPVPDVSDASESDIPAFEEVPSVPPEIATPLEWEDNLTTEISGKRLLLMMESGAVTFIKGAVHLSIDIPALEALEIEPHQLFNVTVLPLEPLRYSVSVNLDGKRLIDIPCLVSVDGNDYEITASGNIDFAKAEDEPDKKPAGQKTVGIAMPPAAEPPVEPDSIVPSPEPSSQAFVPSPTVTERIKESPDEIVEALPELREEQNDPTGGKPFPLPAAGGILLGAGFAAGGAAAFIKFRALRR